MFTFGSFGNLPALDGGHVKFRPGDSSIIQFLSITYEINKYVEDGMDMKSQVFSLVYQNHLMFAPMDSFIN